jgi:threonine aldolase
MNNVHTATNTETFDADLLNSSVWENKEAFVRRYQDESVLFAADVYSPVHAVYQQINEWAGEIYSRGYQLGKVSEHARQVFSEVFGDGPQADNVLALFTPTGTGANRLTTFPVLGAVKGIITSDIAHAVEREAGAIELQSGSKIYTISRHKQHLEPAMLEEFLSKRKDLYWIEPTVLSITNPAEDGTVYSLKEMRDLIEVARKYNMFVQVDGARIFLAAAHLGCSLREMTTDLGVDMLALGGAKCGMYRAEASVFLPGFFEKAGTHHLYKSASQTWDKFRGYLKMHGELVAQAEGIAAQFIHGLTDNFAIKLAEVSNTSARELGRQLVELDGCHLYRPIQTNVVMLSMPNALYEHMSLKYKRHMVFEPQDPERPGNTVVRFMTHHATTPEHIGDLLAHLKSFKVQ